ncbi:putative hydrophobic protein (TIGR00271 family) [Nocardia tenerifensis]|uniref:Putative hydrophobic protein (TIGR00271 family) n=2 Tax=Nocardia tenerifensis TaxID=228006 RepID=A0A318JWB5_9NOCA|nr:putative hydrophobic protein (TIGR00271 family) [Nocardia tenerifensis]
MISPPETTGAVLGVLAANPGATHVTLARGVAVEPAGDLIQADVAREVANDVLAELTELGIDHTGGITLGPVETVLSDAGDRAVEAAPGDPSDAVVWDELLAQVHEESTLNSTFLAFLAIACLLAAIGVATDSPVTIVGAMVVGPEFGPLAAFAVGLVRRDFRLARRSALALAVGFPVAMLITLAATLVWEQFGWITLNGVESVKNVDFIYEVGPFSLVVALLAGAAGMLSLVTAKSAALVGVFISVTTVPAAGFAVVAATVGQWHIAFMSAGQLAVNLVGIIAAGVLVLQLRPRAGNEAGPVARFERWIGMRSLVGK